MPDPIVVDAEQLGELREVLGKIPGSETKPWALEIYDLCDDGTEIMVKSIDIRTGKTFKRLQKPKNRRQEAPG